MTVRAIAGLAALNVLVLAVGACVLSGMRGWRSWGELVRLAGVAYLIGLASLFVVVALELVVGLPVVTPTIVLTGVALAGCGVAVGRRRGHELPSLRSARFALPRLTLFGALFVAAGLVYLEAVFRAGRLEWLWEWDAWRVWTLVAKDIYFTGAIDPALPKYDYASYPPAIPALQAFAFHAMGSPDVVTVHVQMWFFLIGFVAAVAGLLGPHVRQEILLPCLLLLLLAPNFTERVVWMLADLPLDYLLAVAAVLLVFWVEDGQAWRLAAATVLLGGALVIKREGLLLVACVFAASFAASWSQRRWAWPRLAASVVVAFVLALPWWIWILAHDVRGQGPENGILETLSDAERAWPSLKVVLHTFVDGDLWLLLPYLGIGSMLLAFLVGARRVAVFATAFLGSSLVASTWIIWANPSFGLTQDPGSSPVVRLVGGPVLILGVLTPLLLARSLARVEAVGTAAAALPTRGRWPWAPWVVVVAAALAYPASMAVGYSGYRLPGGPPRFPSASDCVLRPVEGDQVRVVLGYTSSYQDAFALRSRGEVVGLGTARVSQDGCGRLRVFVGGLPSLASGEQLVARARARQIDATIERDPGS